MQTSKPWERYAAAGGAPVSQPAPYTVGSPNPVFAAREQRAVRADNRAEMESQRAEERFRLQQAQQAERDRRQAEADQRADNRAAQAAVAASRLPGDKEKSLRDAVSTVSSLGRATAGFRDDYLGFGAGIENFAQSYTDFGTPGQRDWWADFKSTDNLTRNELFGASLTAGEKAAYAATTITPDMSPAQAKKNIARREEIARGGLTRYRDYLLASGYGKEAIDALIGQALNAPVALPNDKPARPEEGTPFGKRYNSLSISSVTDLAAGLSGGEYSIEKDGLYYSPRGGKREPVNIADEIANSAEYRAAYRAKFDEDPAMQVSVEGGAPSAPNLAVRRGQGGFGETADAFARGAADTALLGGADEISAAARTVFGEGTMRDNLNAERAVDAYDQQNHGLSRFGGQFAGGFALPMGAAGRTGATASDLARIGAAYGGAYGFGSGEGAIYDRLIAAGTGAATGGLTSYGLGRAGQALVARSQRSRLPAGVDADTLDAAGRQGVELTRADLDPSRRNTYAFLESMPFAGSRIRHDIQRGADQIEQRVEQIGGSGSVPRMTAGETIRAGGERFIDQSRRVVNVLYDRAATLAGAAQVAPRQALNAIDNHIAELSQTPNANRTKLELLNQFRGDLVDDAGNLRPLTIQAIRDLRTAMRDELGTKGLRFTDTERRIMDAIGSASVDIASQLQGPALRAYQRADRAFAARANLVDNVIERFIGADRRSPRSGEAIMAQLENAAQPRSGDAIALSQMMQRLQPQERQQVAATIAAQLGRRGVDGDAAFSPALFFSQLSKYSPEARTAVFGVQGARDLADLARIAQARTAMLGRLNNSRSGQVSNWFRAIQSILSGGGAGAGVGAAMGGVAGAGAGATTGLVATPALLGGTYLTARALGDRRIVSTLIAAANASTPSRRAAVVSRLAAISAREPALGMELLPMQRLLSSSIDGAGPALADERGDQRQ